MKAAVLNKVNALLEIEEVHFDKPAATEVRIRTVASGFGGSDLHVKLGENPWPQVPVILGHEGAGIVEEVGRSVTMFKSGDHVVSCCSIFCGNCSFCHSGQTYLCESSTPLRGKDTKPRVTNEAGKELEQFAYLGSFSESMLVDQGTLVKIRDDMPLDIACSMGCGILTGFGAAVNTAKIQPGETAAVIGCGSVGLSVIQGCRIAGASRVIAIDMHTWKLELAEKLGATDTIKVGDHNSVAELLELTKGGADYVFECVGNRRTAIDAIEMTRRGGISILLGLMPAGDKIELDGFTAIINAKTIVGSLMGSNQFRRDIPRLVDYFLNGQLNMSDMISQRISLAEINKAFDEMQSGSQTKSIVVFD